jgi:hypothetical protein
VAQGVEVDSEEATVSDDKGTENLTGCFIGLLLMPFMVALRGWVLATLWRWLIVPVFNLHALSVWQAIGMSVVIGAFTLHLPPRSDESALEGVLRSTIYSLICYGLALLTGYIVAAHV